MYTFICYDASAGRGEAKMQSYSQDLRDRVMWALDRGERPTAIARRLEVSRVWVYRVRSGGRGGKKNEFFFKGFGGGGDGGLGWGGGPGGVWGRGEIWAVWVFPG